MRTPAGSECRYYYQDFHRGRSIQECRLLKRAKDSLPWEPQICRICSVPGILRANRCPHMTLHARLVRRWWLWRRVLVEAYCTKHQVEVDDPYVGCGHCHPETKTVFVVREEDHDAGDSP